MLPRERVEVTLDHREPDQVPWGEHLIDYNVYEAILGRPTFVNSHFYETKAYWEGRRDEVVKHYKRDLPDLAGALGLDIVTLPATMPPKGYSPTPFEKIDEETYRNPSGDIMKVSGGHWLLLYKPNPDTYVPPTVDSVQREIDELADLPSPEEDATDSGWEVHRTIVQEMKGTHYIATLCAGITFPGFGIDSQESWINLIDEPEICRKMAELRGKRAVRAVQIHAALGVDAVIPCGDLGHSTGLSASPQIYRELVYPWQKAQAEEAHRLGLKILLHCCGHTMPIVHHLAEVHDAYEAIQASAGMDIGVLKDLIGDRTTLWGGIRHENLNGGTPEDIRSDARYAISRVAPGGGFIIGSTHSLAVGAKIENVMEMKRCRDEWGNYPILIE